MFCPGGIFMNQNNENEKQVPISAFKKVFSLNQLILEAGHAATKEELIFFILNHSVKYCFYSRASLWEIHARPVCRGISGTAAVNSKSKVVKDTAAVIGLLKDHFKPQIITAESFAELPPEWDSLQKANGGTSAVWSPLVCDGKLIAGIWFEAWEGHVWNEHDLEMLAPLTAGFAMAWRPFLARRSRITTFLKQKKAAALLVLILIAALCLIEVPLRVIAPCEVVPDQPEVITAPLDGVIDTIKVQPGDHVKKGQLLFVYDKRVALEELNISQQQVKIIWSELDRSRALAFTDEESKRHISSLETRLKQEQIKLRIAQHKSEKLEVSAEKDSVVMMGDPNEWTGRPVTIGERVMQLFDPGNSKLRVWLPQSDAVDFDPDRQIKVILNAASSRTQRANLTFISQHAEPSPGGTSAFLAEAHWADGNQPLQMGLKGSAILYGENVPLWYWIFRRPLFALRRTTGL